MTMVRSLLCLFCLSGVLWAESTRSSQRPILGSDGSEVWNVDVVWSSEKGSSRKQSPKPESEVPLSDPLRLKSFKGDVRILRPMMEERALMKNDELQVWDRLILGKKSELSFEWRGSTVCSAGSDSVLQVVDEVGGQPVLRLFKGRLRVENKSKDYMLVETLNSMISVPFGKSDIIISAMNTLVAPREGEKVKVKTKKVSKTVQPGRYGLVMADGSLLYTGGKAK
jgi:hypothetical protein